MKHEWKAAGTFVKGIYHESQKIGCQDRYSYNYIDRAVSISLADGAGSALKSEIGAEISTKLINKTVLNHFDKIYESDIDVAKNILTHPIRTSFGIFSKRNNCGMDDLATTLLFVCVKDDKFIAGHIGDGILGYLENNKLKILAYPENGEFVNETFFMTSKNYKKKLRLFKGKLNNINGFFLMTDGTCESFFDKRTKSLSPAILSFFDWIDNYSVMEVESALRKNFESLVRSKTKDDCSIGLLKLCIS
jgi:hypothetical protein